jgi:hypothetical protein
LRLPNGNRAVLDARKLTHYCLSREHLRGRHKARVFMEALGIGQGEADELRELILIGIAELDALRLGADAWGERWQVDVEISRRGKFAVVR